MFRTTIYLPKKLKEKIEQSAAKKGIQFSEHVRHILFRYLEDEKSDETE